MRRRGVSEGRGGVVSWGTMLAERGRREWRFEGVASSGAVDRQGDRMSAEALAQMAGAREVPLVAGHGRSQTVIGVVEESVVEDGRLVVRGRLKAGDPLAERLARRVRTGEKQGLSIGGRATAARYEVGEDGKRVRCIEGVELEHVAVCRPAAAQNRDTFVRLV